MKTEDAITTELEQSSAGMYQLAGLNQAGSHLQSGEQGRRAMAFVLVVETNLNYSFRQNGDSNARFTVFVAVHT